MRLDLLKCVRLNILHLKYMRRDLKCMRRDLCKCMRLSVLYLRCMRRDLCKCMRLSIFIFKSAGLCLLECVRLRDLERFLLIKVITRGVMTTLLLLVSFSIDERSFVPPTEHGGDGSFHRGFGAVQLAPVFHEVLLSAFPRVKSELLPSRQRILYLRAEEACRLRDIVILLDPPFDRAIKMGDGSGNFRPCALHLVIVDPMRVMRKGCERIQCVASRVLAECEALGLLAGPCFHAESLHLCRRCVLLIQVLIFRKKCGILNEEWNWLLL